MNSRILQPVLTSISAAALLGACISASGPTYSVYTEKLSDGTKLYRIECGGLLESSATCRAAAEKICSNQPVSPVQERDRWRGPASDRSDPRVLVFRCGTAPAPAPEVRGDAGVTKVVERFTLDADALFAFGKSDLDSILPAGKQSLNQAIARIGDHDKVGEIRVTGYTDRIGSAEMNDRLSPARAEAVRDYLIAHGLDARIIRASGVGSRQPVTKCPDGESREVIACRQPDRRVTISANSH
jgi:outer membrane protein OmpA-like peptidoglycan-associated protein